MKEYTRDEIDSWRVEFFLRDYPRKTAKLEATSIDYFVVPDSLFQGIPNGLFRMTGARHDGYLVGVSEKVPEELQPYFAISEHDEFMKYGLADPDKTLHAEQRIVEALASNKPLRQAYLTNKIMLYNHIVEQSKQDLAGWGFTQADYNGFARANAYLKQMLQDNSSQ